MQSVPIENPEGPTSLRKLNLSYECQNWVINSNFKLQIDEDKTDPR
jgi:hypothetical protein